jgi:hypothetical protein
MHNDETTDRRKHRVWASQQAYNHSLHTVKNVINYYKEVHRHPAAQEALTSVLGAVAVHFSRLQDLLPGVHEIEEVPKEPSQARP